ncbi:MAG TPA: hypothetical protein VMY42_27140 [Thermoguttaceae bacterium]|nr:hypothetical protein [Thermoguttaceae bacterium]
MATYVTHDLGERFLARARFAPFGSAAVTTPDATDQMYIQVLETDCLYDDAGHADGAKCLHTVAGADAPFATVAAGDHLFLAGGPGATVIAGAISEVASVTAGDESVLLTASPYAGDIAGGIVVMRSLRLAIGLDARTVLSESDTISAAEAYEEDGTGYARVLVDPMDSTKWTIDQDATTADYQATSVQVAFTAGGTNWQANRNAFLVAFTGTLAAPANAVLIASIQFSDPVTVGNGESHPFKFRLRFSEA